MPRVRPILVPKTKSVSISMKMHNDQLNGHNFIGDIGICYTLVVIMLNKGSSNENFKKFICIFRISVT